MPDFVDRLPLIRAARDALRDGHLLIEAAAGYGKTVLLQQLARDLVDSAYVRFTIAADDMVVLQALINDLDAGTVLLDDVHVLSAESDSTNWLRKQLEQGEHRFVLAGRTLPFDATLLAATGDAVRWGEAELAFSAEMTGQLLGAEAVGLDGWPLGVGLLRQLPVASRNLAQARDHVFDYFARQIVSDLPDDLQRFLRVTAVPVEFSAELAATLLGIGQDAAADAIQALLRRALFIYPGTQAETYAYHDLFRDYLRSLLPRQELVAISEQLIGIYQAQHPNPQSAPAAIEQALDAQMVERAAELVLDLDWQQLWQSWTYRTVVRWIAALPSALSDQHPELYRIAGHCLRFLPDRFHEATAYLDRAEAFALELDESKTVYSARLERAIVTYTLHGPTDELVAALEEIIANGPPYSSVEVRARDVLRTVLVDLGRFRAVRDRFAVDYARATELGVPAFYLESMRWMGELRLPLFLGAYATARTRFEETLAEVAPDSGDRPRLLLFYCELLMLTGDWQALERAVAEFVDTVGNMSEALQGYTYILAIFSCMVALGKGQTTVAAQHTDTARNVASANKDHLLVTKCRILLQRQLGQVAAVEQILAEIAPFRHLAPYSSAVVQLEADIALGLAAARAGQPYAISAETLNLYRFRTRGELLRLRALVTVLCHQQGNPRWRVFARLVLAELEQPAYPELLIRLDPELGAAFWRVLLAERVAQAAARRALHEIGRIAELLPLLGHNSAETRRDAAAILAAIGDEAAMPALHAAIKGERDAVTKDALQAALGRLEAEPPPPLRINLLGVTQVVRGGEPITAFHRPIVLRLLQYLAINRGRTLPRERVLADLWPESDLDKAARSFRTVYSRLRSALEPMMRRNGPNRYVALDAESIAFDPRGYVTTDVEQFEAALAAALASNAPISDETISLLDAYEPLLADLPYADWLLERRERAHELMVNGSLRVGEELLARGQAAEAQQWARRTIDAAPWLEAAYQLLMRAYSRQNLRSRALRTYAEAQDALQRELAVEPSALTQWLYRRLRAGEEI